MNIIQKLVFDLYTQFITFIAEFIIYIERRII